MSYLKAFIFMGPSRPSIKFITTTPKITICPPIKRGDIFNILQNRPAVIGIIDGYFHHTPSITHKELLFAISTGVKVLGAASLGALRATELKGMGMIGVGEIYNRFCNGNLFGDDEVAVLHKPDNYNYEPITFPLIELRITLENALNRGTVDESIGLMALTVATQMPYTQRTFHQLTNKLINLKIKKELLIPFFNTIQKSWVHQKRIDAQALCQLIAKEISTNRSRGNKNNRGICRKKRTTWEKHLQIKHTNSKISKANVFQTLIIAKFFYQDYIKILINVLSNYLLAQEILNDVENISNQTLVEWWTKKEGGVNSIKKLSELFDLTQDCFLAWLEVLYHADNFKKLFKQKHPRFDEANIWRVCLFHRIKNRQIDLLQTTLHDFGLDQLFQFGHKDLIKLRSPLGSFPNDVLFAAIRIDDKKKTLDKIALEVEKINSATKIKAGNGFPFLLDSGLVVSSFLKQNNLDWEILKNRIPELGFEGFDEFLYGLRLTYAFRESRKVKINWV